MGAAWDRQFAERDPVFAPIAPLAALFASFETFPEPEAIDAALAARAGVRFMRQAPRPRSRRRRGKPPEPLYDARIVEEGVVPTRNGSWHDLLNALVWATFPRAKRALHARQHAIVVPSAPARTREGDTLALLDEGGVLAGAQAVVFGHAIYESFVEGWLPVRGSMLGLASGPSIEERDGALAEALLDPGRLIQPQELERTWLKRTESVCP